MRKDDDYSWSHRVESYKFIWLQMNMRYKHRKPNSSNGRTKIRQLGYGVGGGRRSKSDWSKIDSDEINCSMPSGFSLLLLKSLRGLEDNAEDNRLYARNPIDIASLRPSQLEEFVKETITVSESDAAWLPEKFLNQKPVYLDQEASNSQEEDMKSW